MDGGCKKLFLNKEKYSALKIQNNASSMANRKILCSFLLLNSRQQAALNSFSTSIPMGAPRNVSDATHNAP
jgi:hypothetical protein